MKELGKGAYSSTFGAPRYTVAFRFVWIVRCLHCGCCWVSLSRRTGNAAREQGLEKLLRDVVAIEMVLDGEDELVLAEEQQLGEPPVTANPALQPRPELLQLRGEAFVAKTLAVRV